MDKCREAFEKLPEIKDSLSENIVFVSNKYTTANECFYDLVNWLNGGWYTWQSRQAEVDELQEEYAETELYLRGQLTDRDSKIANLEYLLEQDKSLIPILNKKLKEKDKRIEELESALKKINENLDLHDCESCWQHYFEIEKVLPGLQGGEHE